MTPSPRHPLGVPRRVTGRRSTRGNQTTWRFSSSWSWWCCGRSCCCLPSSAPGRESGLSPGGVGDFLGKLKAGLGHHGQSDSGGLPPLQPIMGPIGGPAPGAPPSDPDGSGPGQRRDEPHPTPPPRRPPRARGRSRPHLLHGDHRRQHEVLDPASSSPTRCSAATSTCCSSSRLASSSGSGPTVRPGPACRSERTTCTPRRTASAGRRRRTSRHRVGPPSSRCVAPVPGSALHVVRTAVVHSRVQRSAQACGTLNALRGCSSAR